MQHTKDTHCLPSHRCHQGSVKPGLLRNQALRSPIQVVLNRDIAKKATLGFLRRNLHHCPPDCRKNAYLALIRSKLEYGSVVWDPYMKGDIDRLDRIQRSAARFITRDYKSRQEGCVTNMH